VCVLTPLEKSDGMIKVSVVIPIYNVEYFLEECLESVINQTLQDIEIICINDCSTDRSVDVLNKYVQKDSRIVVIHNSENKGLSYTRNRGLELAQGEYVYFLDSDDSISMDAMEELYQTAVSLKLDSVFFDATIIFENESLRNKFVSYQAERVNEYPGVFKGCDLFEQFVINREWSSSVPRQFWRRRFLHDRKLSFYEGILHEDELFSFKALLQADRVIYSCKKYFHRRFRENSIMTTAISKKNIEGRSICYFEMIAFWRTVNLSERVNKSIDMHLSSFCASIKSWSRSINSMIDIEEMHHGNAVANHLFKQLITSEFEGMVCRRIEDQKLAIIRQFQRVIIYGAGVVARDVLKLLDKNQIPICAFAVSNPEANPKAIMGTPVYCIEELQQYRDSALILVSVVPKHQESILKKLEQLEFSNVLLMM
jgi:glycosyltransferase involved in cell wall biosynthesis